MGLTALSEDSIVVGKIKMAADVRTNRIHVITRPVNMPFVKRLIGEFDANVDFAKPVTRPLRYISAADVLPVIVQALTEPGEESAGAATQPGGAPNPNATAAAKSERARTVIRAQTTSVRTTRRQPEFLGRTFDAVGRHHAAGGHDRQRQDHRRSTREHDHHSRQSRGGGEGAEDSGRDGRERAAGGAEHGDRELTLE